MKTALLQVLHTALEITGGTVAQTKYLETMLGDYASRLETQLIYAAVIGLCAAFLLGFMAGQLTK